MNIKETLEKGTDLKLQVIESFNHDDDSFYFMAIVERSGVVLTKAIPLRGNFPHNLRSSVDRAAEQLIASEAYLAHMRDKRAAESGMARLQSDHPEAVQAAKDSLNV